MIETEVFQKNFVGRDGFIWWIGQIPNDSYIQNLPGSSAKGAPLGSQAGFGDRYQVRIMGYHTANKDELPDIALPWASIMLPVTAGGGYFNNGSSRLEAGNFVYGFFLDGEDAQQPVIMGILGWNQYQAVMGKVPPVGFVPFGGYSNPVLNGTPTFKIYSRSQRAGLGVTTGTFAEENAAAQAEINKLRTTGNAGQTQAQTKERDLEKRKSQQKRHIASGCDRGASGIQITISNLIQDIQGVQQDLRDFGTDVQNFEQKVIQTQAYIQAKLQKASEIVSGWIKDKIKEIMAWTVKKISDAIKPLLNFLHQDWKSDVKSITEKALELLVCAFKKIISKILDIVLNALTQAVGRFIQVPLCAAENILAAIIGKLMGLVRGIVGMVSGIINGVLGAVNMAIDVAGDLVGFLDAILSIFEICDSNKGECPRITDWSIWDGSTSDDNPFDLSGIADKIKHFASGVSDAVDIDNFDFDLDFSDVFDISMCDTGPKFCGPPQLVFWGGSGTGALGNAIISSSGNIIGVEIVSAGHGYEEEAPYIRFKDDCGKGQGAVAVPEMGPVSPDDLKPYRAKRQNINKVPPTSPDYWELITIPTEGLPLWNPKVTYYGERTIPTQKIEYLPADENANLKTLYQNSDQAENDGYQIGCTIGVTTTSYNIIPADIVAYSPKWSYDEDGDYVGVTGVLIPTTGYGYLSVPDGSRGGDGITWAESDDTIVEHSDGTWDLPYSPGMIVPVKTGDTLSIPVGSDASSVMYGTDGSVTEILGGSNAISTDGVLTAPASSKTSVESENTYPVVLHICQVSISNPGYNYQSTDKVVIEPANGAEIVPTFGPVGNLIALNLVSGGEGFLEMPRAYIESETGFNAEITIRLCIDRIGDDVAKEPGVRDKVVSVIDCVGKV